MVEETVEILKDKLFWISTTKVPKSKPNSLYLNTDNTFTYSPLSLEFGPLNLNLLYKFTFHLNFLLRHPEYQYQRIYHITSQNYANKANSALLMGCFSIIILNKTAIQANDYFKAISFTPFRDAGQSWNDYKCTLLDCFLAIEQAIRLNWFDYREFNSFQYEFFEKIENGDMNWVIPKKILAFSCPSAYKTTGLSAETYSHLFKRLNIGTVIRLNKPKYEKNILLNNGIKHYDLYFPDGSVPSEDIIDRFIHICLNEKNRIAVHCKAGLGRTGTVIGCFAIKVYKFPANQFIAWCRMCRPGSIIGEQQQFLLDYEKSIKESGEFPEVYKKIDRNQANRLIFAKTKPYEIFQEYNIC